jgi:hypothetical protein
MLAALIATRNVPPPPPVLFYTNQLAAATTTFTCITITRRAAFITTSLPARYVLALSVPGRESFLDQLNRAYYRLISQIASDNPTFLSNNILEVIGIVQFLTPVLAALPVAGANAVFLRKLQQQLAIALAFLQSLGAPVN